MNRCFTKIKRLVPWTMMMKKYSNQVSKYTMEQKIIPKRNYNNNTNCTIFDDDIIDTVYLMGCGITYIGLCTYTAANDAYDYYTKGYNERDLVKAIVFGIPISIAWPLGLAFISVLCITYGVGAPIGYAMYLNAKRKKSIKAKN